eukprot:Gb_34942 [translate_table: standard]
MDIVVLASADLSSIAHKGADLAAQEVKSAAALAACRTLAEELTEQRFPAPRILSFKFMHQCFAVFESYTIYSINIICPKVQGVGFDLEPWTAFDSDQDSSGGDYVEDAL